MSELLNLANAVADSLAEYRAEVTLFPEFDLRELDEMRVAVVPLSTEYKTLSRTACEELLKIQIGVLKRCNGDGLDDALRFVEALGLGFLNRKLAGAACVAAGYNPIYSPEHLRERGQFTSVIELTFKLIR